MEGIVTFPRVMVWGTREEEREEEKEGEKEEERGVSEVREVKERAGVEARRQGGR